jgi:hypothetical protein|tara:strand:- start:75 stop:455 length:381 start_codon:yes stop_codon:yes gene_type:complete
MMKKLIIGIALATCVSSVAMAEAVTVAPYKILPPVDFSVVSDTAYNVTTEVASTEFGVVAGYEGIELALLPVYDWDSAEISDIQLAAAYTYEVTSTFALTPYGEYHVDKDMTEVSKVIGIKSSFKF